MVSTSGRQILAGTFIHCTSRTELEYIHDAAVCVDEKGVIVKIERDSGDVALATQRLCETLGWAEGDVKIYRCKEGEFFFPGFIDTHIHASQYPNAGIFGKSTLLSWLETYTFPLESSLSDLKKADRVYSACIKRTLAHGTTTAAYYATIDVPATNLLADLCLSLGQRAFVGRVCMDNAEFCPDYYRDESVAEGMRKTRETVEYVESIDPGFELVSPIITPRFALSCTSESMRELAKLSEEKGLAIQTHISENEGEIELVESQFPEQASYAEVYDAHGLLTPRTVLAHAVHLTAEEIALCKERKAKISHCPCSNSSLTSGVARVRYLWEQGLDIGLGTDVSGGYSASILEAARQAALVSRHIAMTEPLDQTPSSKLTVEEVLYLATRGGALCLGLDNRVGGFEVGKEFDAQMVRGGGGNVDLFGWESWEERMAKWVYGGDDRNTEVVWVKGRVVHKRE